MKFYTTEEFIDYDKVEVKTKANYEPSEYENTFITEELLLTPLYKKIEFNPNQVNFTFFPFSDVRVECYCPKCNCRRIFCFENSTLASYNTRYNKNEQESIGSILHFTKIFNFKAKADCKHYLFVNFAVVDDNHIMKIGQYPSVYDMNEEVNNKKFLKQLDSEYKRYYINACSLYSYNNCIGAMVYLRRIFEKVLMDAFAENQQNIKINIDDFKILHMKEKIDKLKEYLPDLLFESGFNTIYSKVSDGIHNLTEEECEKMFPVLKSAIDEVLIDNLEKREKAKRRKEISKSLTEL